YRTARLRAAEEAGRGGVAPPRDEPLGAVGNHDDGRASGRGDVVRAAAARQGLPRMPGVADSDRRVDVPEDVALGRAEKAHVDHAPLEQAEHVMEAPDRRGRVHEAEVA